MYVLVATRQKCAHVKGLVSKLMYGTKEKCVYNGKWNLTHCYYGSDMAGNVDIQNSISGYIFTHAGGDISWNSRLKRILGTKASKEAIYLPYMFMDLGFPQQVPILHCDSQSTYV